MNERRRIKNVILLFFAVFETVSQTVAENKSNEKHYHQNKSWRSSERSRRLIPYMTFHITGQNGHSYGVTENSEKFLLSPQLQQFHQNQHISAMPYHLIPIRNIVNGNDYHFQYEQNLLDYQQQQQINDKPLIKPSKIITQSHFSIRPEYLKFRYSELEENSPTTTTTPPTELKITSPKSSYYFSTGPAISVTTEQFLKPDHYNKPTKLQLPNYDRITPSSRFSPTKYITKPVKPITTMTIMKSHEIPIEPNENLFQNPSNQLFVNDEQPKTESIAPSTEQNFAKDSIRVYFAPPKQSSTIQQWQDAPKLTTGGEHTFTDLLNNGGYKLNEQLPERITPGNIKQSIQTLSYILQLLQKADSITKFDDNPLSYEQPRKQQIYSENYNLLNDNNRPDIDLNEVDDSAMREAMKDNEGTPGRPGIDYPIYSVIPPINFSCKSQRYKGFFADTDTKCQVWHYCDLNGGQASFLCPNGTVFNQAALTCDWWFNVKCASTPQLYVLNERLYKYILPARPSFPEDFSGPLVDLYLTEKFKELESKKKNRVPGNVTTLLEAHMAGINDTATIPEDYY